jgi:beta-hydroxylase
MEILYSPGLIILYILIICTLIMQYRGKVRMKFVRQVTDFSVFTAPVNCFMYLFSKVPNAPFLDRESFKELDLLKDNWEMIRDEAKEIYAAGHIKKSEKLDDIAFNSFFRTGWTRFYLKWYKGALPSAEPLCPKTLELLKKLPNVKAAMFVMLPPGARLGKHRDPYAGSLRYHLGLEVPGTDDCFIEVDDQKYSWRDGQDVLFDETYIHWAHNQSQKNRLILFCDVARPMNNPVATLVNKFVSRVLVSGAQTKNMECDKTGFLNKIFGTVFQIRIFGKKLKKLNRKLYYTAKYVAIIALVYLIFFNLLG